MGVITQRKGWRLRLISSSAMEKSVLEAATPAWWDLAFSSAGSWKVQDHTLIKRNWWRISSSIRKFGNNREHNYICVTKGFFSYEEIHECAIKMPIILYVRKSFFMHFYTRPQKFPNFCKRVRSIKILLLRLHCSSCLSNLITSKKLGWNLLDGKIQKIY